jgi:hypothetical protein
LVKSPYQEAWNDYNVKNEENHKTKQGLNPRTFKTFDRRFGFQNPRLLTSYAVERLKQRAEDLKREQVQNGKHCAVILLIFVQRFIRRDQRSDEIPSNTTTEIQINGAIDNLMNVS